MANLLPETVPAPLRRAVRGRGRVHLAALSARVRRRPPSDHYDEDEKIHLPDSPPPRLSDVLKQPYAHGIVQCTRGCPFTCEFCDIIVMYGRKMHFKPVEQVLERCQAWLIAGASSSSSPTTTSSATAPTPRSCCGPWPRGTTTAPAAVVLHAGQHRHGARRGTAGPAPRRQLHLGLHRHRVAAKASLAETHKTPKREDRSGGGDPQDPVVQHVHLGRHDRRLRQRRRRHLRRAVRVPARGADPHRHAQRAAGGAEDAAVRPPQGGGPARERRRHGATSAPQAARTSIRCT